MDRFKQRLERNLVHISQEIKLSDAFYNNFAYTGVFSLSDIKKIREGGLRIKERETRLLITAIRTRDQYDGFLSALCRSEQEELADDISTTNA